MKIFITDGTAAAFFTAVFDAYREKECIITSDSRVQLAFDSEVVRITSDRKKNERVQNAILKCDRQAVDDVILVLRSGDPSKEQTAFEYLKKLLEIKSPISKMLSLPQVIEFNEMARKVTGEIHMLKGLLRFMESREGVLYAPYSPDNDITDLLMPHFAERFKSEKFVIHDVKRKFAGMYDGHEWITGYAGEAEVYLSEYEQAFKNLWKKYYNSVNIKERPHIKQMKGYMPVRYWKFLPEKNGN
ncbi:MAG: TIGR03915 family putative DNA repair protein [Clostridia bacterium]|nr:TIGR03915 family putative DNA repair protein [Clostridia bacterium]